MADAVLRKQQKGTIAIEVAILTPLILLFFMLAVEFGFFFSYGYQLQGASYRGARYAAQHWNSDMPDVKQRAELVAVYGIPHSNRPSLLPNLKTEHVKLTPPDNDDGYINVSIKYVYQPVFPLTELLGLNPGKALQAQSVMRVL